ncbi:G protein pathway suppressor 1 [Coprinopsis sp. MPI-PUGE-AT-0042]|nr:G protein pathway suppressor 1 [Coprinopsis sp. MPI-PUGE-AT-0042]
MFPLNLDSSSRFFFFRLWTAPNPLSLQLKQPTRRPILAPADVSFLLGLLPRRLTHIILTCPSIAPEAFQLAVQHAHQSRDRSLYQTYSPHTNSLPNLHDLAQLDTKSMDEAIARNRSERTKLEVELKTYTNNTIKESIRMAHGDLGNFYRDLGDYAASLKHCTKSREFCTTSQHLLIDQRNYSPLTTYVFKADTALDAAKAAAAPPPAQKAAAVGEREDVQAKLSLPTALSHLDQSHYEKAANSLLNVGSPSNLGDWIGKLVAPGDITIYTTVTRFQYSSTMIQTRHYIAVHLAPHVHDLSNLIRNWAAVLYFQPFATIHPDRMIVGLIQSRHIQGRVDGQNKILQSKNIYQRPELFARAIKPGSEIQAANRKLLLPMKLYVYFPLSPSSRRW